MTLPSTGVISHDMIRGELGGPNPIALSEYYGTAPGLPVTGEIANTDFYGITRVNQTIITVGSSKVTWWAERRGFGMANKTSFLHPEAGQSYAAFGAASVTSYILGGYTLYGIHAGRNDPFSKDKWVIITGSNPRGVAGNWAYLRARRVGTTAWTVVDREEHFTNYGANALGIGYLLFTVKSQLVGDPVFDLWNLLQPIGSQIELEFF